MKKVLIVDDSAFARLTLRRMLEEAGYETREAADGLSALELTATYTPDVITVDLLMPQMQGHDLVTSLRTLCAECRLIVITANVQEAARKDLMEAGAAAFLTKPVDRDELLGVIGHLPS